MKGIDYSRLYIHDRRDDGIRDIVEVKETLHVRGREGFIDQMLHHLPFVRHQRHFRAAISLINTEVHDNSQCTMHNYTHNYTIEV